MEQEVLISTIHNIDNVVEVYLNPIDNLVSELVHLSKGHTHISQIDIETYLNKDFGYKGVEQELLNFFV